MSEELKIRPAEMTNPEKGAPGVGPVDQGDTLTPEQMANWAELSRQWRPVHQRIEDAKAGVRQNDEWQLPVRENHGQPVPLSEDEKVRIYTDWLGGLNQNRPVPVKLVTPPSPAPVELAGPARELNEELERILHIEEQKKIARGENPNARRPEYMVPPSKPQQPVVIRVVGAYQPPPGYVPADTMSRRPKSTFDIRSVV